jgi:hypothetical protein
MGKKKEFCVIAGFETNQHQNHQSSEKALHKSEKPRLSS